MRRQGSGRGRRDGRVSYPERSCTGRLSTSVFERPLMAVIEEERTSVRANMQPDGLISTKTDYIEDRSSGSQRAIPQNSFAREPHVAMNSVVRDALTQGWKALGDVSVGE